MQRWYRDESPPLIGMHNSWHSNCNLDTERVTGSVDNSHSHSDCGEETRAGDDESDRHGGQHHWRNTVVFSCKAMWELSQ